MTEDRDCRSTVEVAVAGFAGCLGCEQAGVAGGVVECVAEVASLVVRAHGVGRAELGSAHGISEHACEPVGARNPVVAGQAALRYSLMSPPQRVARMIRSCCCPLAFGGLVDAGGR